jgi:competence protein ComEC
MAGGAVVGYYGTAFLPPNVLARCILGFLAVYTGSIGAARAVLVFSETVRNRARILFLMSGAVGVFIGFATGKQSPLIIGLPTEQVNTIYGILRDDPRIVPLRRGEQALGTLSLLRVKGLGGVQASAKGEVLVFFPEGAIPRLKEFGRGCEIYIEGNFVKREARGEYAFFAESTHITKPASRTEQFRARIRANLAERFSGFAWGGLGLALLFGMKDDVDSTLSKQYREAGCSHVLALSGMHLAVVSAVLAFFLKKPLGLHAAAVIGAVFILVYVYLAGDFPSLNRAAIMYLLGTVIVLFNLPKDTLSVLAMTFVLQIIFQRGEGLSVSFILSYLALFGILVLGNPIYGFFRGWMPDPLGRSLAVSIAAFVCTAYVSAAFFSVLYPVGIIAGLVIVPLTTLFMMGALFAMAVSFVPMPLPSLLSDSLSLLYAVISRIVAWASLPPALYTPNATLVLLATLAFIGFVLFTHTLRVFKYFTTGVIRKEAPLPLS